MKLAVMQPYIFPYIGYFQLMQAADIFVYYDDVNFIKHGWINRNQILLNKKSYLFTVPIKNISSFRKIKETKIAENYENWRVKFLKSLGQAYRRAPYFNKIFPMVETVLNHPYVNISDLAIASVEAVMDYMCLYRKTMLSSDILFDYVECDRTEKLIFISKHVGCNEYINPIGGKDIYSKEDFMKEGIVLKFLSPFETEYKQFDNIFVNSLSIIDVLMFNDISTVQQMIKNHVVS